MPTLDELKTQLDAIAAVTVTKSDEIIATLTTMQAQIDAGKSVEAELRAQIDKLQKDQATNQADFLKAHEALKKFEARAGRVEVGAGGKISVKQMNYGRSYRKSEQYKTWFKNRTIHKESEPCVFKKSFFSPGLELKASDIFDDDNAEALVDPFFRSDIVEQNKRLPVHRNWVNVVPISGTNEIIVKREKKEHFLAVKVTADAIATATELVLESVAGLSKETKWNVVKINNATGPETLTISNIDEATLTITFAPALVGSVDKDDLLTADQFVFTADAKLKPKSLDEYENVEVKVYTLATWVEATNQQVADAAMLEDVINRKLLTKLARNEERMFFYGPGTAGQWLGIFNDTAIPQIKWSDQDPGTTKVDMFLYAWTVVAVAEHTANAGFVNPQDFRDMMLTKGDDGHYVFWQVQVANMPAMVFTIQIVSTTAVDPGEACAGEWDMAVTIYDRMEGEIRIGWIDKMFIKNTKAILAEERAAMVVEIPAALVRILFDSQP